MKTPKEGYWAKEGIFWSKRQLNQIYRNYYGYWDFYEKLTLIQDNKNVIQMMQGGKNCRYYINHNSII